MKEIFEIHITGDETIVEQAKQFDLKTIVIDLLKPDKSYFRTEYMVSHIHKCNNYSECKEYVDNIVSQLTNVLRVKIESMFYKHYVGQSLYLEIHKNGDSDYPTSRNRNKDYSLVTCREYDKDKYMNLLDKLGPESGIIVELCLFDSNVNEDKDWFDLYGRLSY